MWERDRTVFFVAFCPSFFVQPVFCSIVHCSFDIAQQRGKLTVWETLSFRCLIFSDSGSLGTTSDI